jgi:N-methylhydantoinase A
MAASETQPGYTVAVDIGGTFTDMVAIDPSTGRAVLAKRPSVPRDFVKGVDNVLQVIGDASVGSFRHGTTVGTNAIIERRGVRTGLITTAGFRDILLAARASRPDLYNSHWDPPPALVPRRHILTVTERIDYRGHVIAPLAEEEVRDAVRQLRAFDVQAVAVCFLNAFINPVHERRTVEIVHEEWPDVFVCASSTVLPEIREFERTSTTVANAYLGPLLSDYLDRLTHDLRGHDFAGEVMVSHSAGGLMTSASARRLPARICQSGPAAGVMGARAVTERVGYQNAISLDMGGTSADISVIVDNRPAVRPEYNIEFNIPIIFPSIDLVTIGAGGGTIAWIDDVGVLHSGPESAGADPGPACYGLGGIRPTNTDANVVLGRIRSDRLLGGTMSIDRSLAEEAIRDRIAEPMGMSVVQAAAAMIELSNAAMINAIRLMTIQRGHDPRDFAIVAFGGAGALHAADLAREMGIKRVVIPPYPGVLSAFGALQVDVRHDFLRPLFQVATELNRSAIEHAMKDLDDEIATVRGHEAGIRDWKVEYQADLRYYGQISGYLTLNVPPGDPVEAIAQLPRVFRDEHMRQFGYVLPQDAAEIEVVNLRATLIGIVDKPYLPMWEPNSANRPALESDVYFLDQKSFLRARIVEREELRPGSVIEGPAIVEEWDSTTVVPPGAVVTVAEGGEMLMELRGANG